ADLVLGIAPALLTLARPDVALVPVDPGRDEVAQNAVADPLETLDIAGLVAALGAGDDRQALLPGFLVGCEHPADAGPVDCDRFLGEELLAGLDDRLDVQGPEAGWGRQRHEVAAVDHLLVGIEPDEAAVIGDVELLLTMRIVPDTLAAVLEVVFEDVAHGVERDVGAGARGLADVLGRAGAAPTAADQPDLDCIAA